MQGRASYAAEEPPTALKEVGFPVSHFTNFPLSAASVSIFMHWLWGEEGTGHDMPHSSWPNSS